MLLDNEGNADVALSMAASPCLGRDNHLSALECGARLQSYTIEAVLGAGGFGITYKAVEDFTDRVVAIKEYLPSSLAVRDRDSATVRPLSDRAASDFAWGLERFRAEAKLLIGFHHPNIVPVLAYFEANRTGYLVMEYQDGTSLAAVLGSPATAMPETQVLQLMLPLLDGVEEVHRRNFLHRDIKPDNIFIRKDGTPVLLDFGAARQALGARSKKFTAILTEGYAPFEQYADTGNQGPWSDIYALGAVMFECLTGRSAVEAPQRVSARMRGIPDPMAQDFAVLRVAVSSAVAFAVEAALRVVDAERPQTIAALRELIVAATPASNLLPTVTPTPPANTLLPDLAQRHDVVRYPPSWHTAQRRKPRRTQRYAAFGALAVAVAVGVALHLGDRGNWPAEGVDGAGAASIPPRKMWAQVASNSKRNAEPSAPRNTDEAGRQDQIAEQQRSGDDKDLEERRTKALVDHQQRQIERSEEEWRQMLAAIRAAEAERQRAAEAERKKSLERSY